MTQNQINFAKVREDIRHNLAVEDVNRGTLSETARHNTQDEGIRWYTAQEQKRHNTQDEDVRWYSAGETGRHNVATENLNWYSAQNMANLQYYQGQQAQSQAYLNDVRALWEPEQIKLDQWYKEHQVELNSEDVEIRKRAQYAAERQIDAQITNLLTRLGLDQELFKYEKARIVSEIVESYAKAGQNVGNLGSTIAKIIAAG